MQWETFWPAQQGLSVMKLYRRTMGGKSIYEKGRSAERGHGRGVWGQAGGQVIRRDQWKIE